jgi:hypothetical protein
MLKNNPMISPSNTYTNRTFHWINFAFLKQSSNVAAAVVEWAGESSKIAQH